MQPKATEPDGLSLNEQSKLHDTGRINTTNDHKEQTKVKPMDTATVGDESVELTGIGRTVTEGGVTRVIDEAHWKPHIQPDTNRSFALVVSMNAGRQQLSVKSAFLVSLFEDVIKRTGMMGMTKGSEGISFLEPYVPLYWSYDHIIQSGSEADHPSQQDIKDLQSLRYWYERWVLPAHNQIRETIHSGFIAFSDLWALYRPGEMLYTQDDFEQPGLSIVIEARYEFAPMGHPGPAGPHGHPGPYDPPLPPQAGLPGPPRASSFSVRSWHQAWEPSRQMFIKSLALTPMMIFDGSRRISDLGAYPVRFFGGGDKSQIGILQQNLENRGRRWKELFGPSVQHLYHEGPATMEHSGIFKNDAMFDDMGYGGQSETHVGHDKVRRTTHSKLTTVPTSFHRESWLTARGLLA